ncbi:hypothetical protein D3C71_1734440 [compost metagenome]
MHDVDFVLLRELRQRPTRPRTEDVQVNDRLVWVHLGEHFFDRVQLRPWRQRLVVTHEVVTFHHDFVLADLVRFNWGIESHAFAFFA